MTTVGTWFYATIRDDETGAVVIPEFECWVETSVTIKDGEPEIEIEDIKVGDSDWSGNLTNGVSLWKGEDFTQRLASRVLSQIEADIAKQGKFFQSIIGNCDAEFVGHPGDPDAFWRPADHGEAAA